MWERDELAFEAALNDDFVVLELDADLSVGQSPFGNLLIEGDNFDALRYLHIAYKERVKCIYIDPPYNLGGKDFIYNDNYVDKDDAYRHSKWLEFMYRRLRLAKDLLTDDGVIFISIDDVENAHLTLLMDQVFPGKRVGTFVWRRRSGANDEKEWFISVDHEYVLCYANKGFSFAGNKKELNDYSNPDNDERGAWVSSDLTKRHNVKQRENAFYPIHNPESDIWYPCNPDYVWAYATKNRVNGKKLRAKSIEQMIEEGRILWPQVEKMVSYESVQELLEAIGSGKSPSNLRIYSELENLQREVIEGKLKQKVLDCIEPIENWIGRKIGFGKPRYKRFAKELKRTEQPVSTWILPASTKKDEFEDIDLDGLTTLEVGFTSEGTKLLSQMVSNKDFPYPKPMSLVKALVDQATDGEGGHIVLDFFAGSGTTGHSVLALNAEDAGNRSFILVSSTESTMSEPQKNVCRDITAKRLRAATSGYSYRTPKSSSFVEGLGGEFAYMRCNRISRETLAIDIRHDQIWYALQQMHANSVAPFDADSSIQILHGDEIGHDIIYIPQLNEAALSFLRVRTAATFKPVVIYSWQPGVIRQRFPQSHIKFEKIPDYLIQRFGRVDQ